MGGKLILGILERAFRKSMLWALDFKASYSRINISFFHRKPWLLRHTFCILYRFLMCSMKSRTITVHCKIVVPELGGRVGKSRVTI